MTAVLIPTASDAEWLSARRSGISASEIAPLMGLSNWTSPYALYHRKRGNLPEQEDNLAMAVGRHMESFVASLFAEAHPEFSLWGDGRQLYANRERSWQLATPDRLLSDYERWADLTNSGEYLLADGALLPLAVLECKTAGSYDGWGEDGTDEIPVAYRCQVLWQCDVLGVGAWFVACLFMHSRKLRIYHGTLDYFAAEDLKIMRNEAEAFLRCLELGIEPAVDWRPATADALKRLHPTVVDVDVPVKRMPIIRYRAAIKAHAEAVQRKLHAENVLRQLLGDGHRAVDARSGEVVARRDVYDLPEKTITRKASTVNRLVHVPPKETSTT